MKIRDNNFSSHEGSATITMATIPAVVCGKTGNFIVEYNHNILHNLKGCNRGPEFYQAIADKLDLAVNISDVNEIKGEKVGSSAEFGSWSELDINHFHRNDEFQVTFNLGYEANPAIELNPAGITITFAFTE